MNTKLFLILWISIGIAGCSTNATPRTIVVTATSAPPAATVPPTVAAPAAAASSAPTATTAPASNNPPASATATTAPPAAAAATTQPTLPPAQPTSTVASAAMPVTGMLTQVSANTLLDYKAFDSAGNLVGDVKDLVVSPNNGSGVGQISYVVIDSSLREDWQIPVPWKNVTIRPETQSVILPAAVSQLATAPGFDKHAWPSSFSTAAAGLQSYWANPAQAAAVALPGPAVTQAADYIRAKDLLDLKIINPQGAKLGKIKDLAIDWANSQPGSADTAKFSYAVLSLDDSINPAEPMVPIPWRLVQMTPNQETMVLNLSAAALQAVPNFGQGAFPDLYAGPWVAQLSQFWNGK